MKINFWFCEGTNRITENVEYVGDDFPTWVEFHSFLKQNIASLNTSEEDPFTCDEYLNFQKTHMMLAHMDYDLSGMSGLPEIQWFDVNLATCVIHGELCGLGFGIRNPEEARFWKMKSRFTLWSCMDNASSIHIKDCCFFHGCKHGDKTCMVASGQIRGAGPCETCEEN